MYKSAAEGVDVEGQLWHMKHQHGPKRSCFWRDPRGARGGIETTIRYRNDGIHPLYNQGTDPLGLKLTFTT